MFFFLNTDKLPSVILYINVFVFEVHRKDWLSNSGETNKPDILCYIFSTSQKLYSGRWLYSNPWLQRWKSRSFEIFPGFSL